MEAEGGRGVCVGVRGSPSANRFASCWKRVSCCSACWDAGSSPETMFSNCFSNPQSSAPSSTWQGKDRTANQDARFVLVLCTPSLSLYTCILTLHRFSHSSLVSFVLTLQLLLFSLTLLCLTIFSLSSVSLSSIASFSRLRIQIHIPRVLTSTMTA